MKTCTGNQIEVRNAKLMRAGEVRIFMSYRARFMMLTCPCR
jgi:hypothetical protein